MNKTTIEAIESLPVPWHLQCEADGCERLAVFRHEEGTSKGCALHVADYPDEKWIPMYEDDSSTGVILRLSKALREQDAEMQDFRDVVREYIAAIDEERALDAAAAAIPARWPDAYARAVDQRDAAHVRAQATESTLRKIVDGDR